MSDTYHLSYLSDDTANYIIQTTPFFPRIEPTGAELGTITFNAGFVYDYADQGDRKAVRNLQLPVSLSGTQKFFLCIGIGEESGRIDVIDIINEEEKALRQQQRGAWTNMVATSTYEAPTSGSSKYIIIDLAEILDGHLEHLYLRENVHIWFRGFKQVGAGYQQDGNGAVMDPSSSLNSNGIIKFRTIQADPNKTDPANVIEVRTSGENIYLYAPAQSNI